MLRCLRDDIRVRRAFRPNDAKDPAQEFAAKITGGIPVDLTISGSSIGTPGYMSPEAFLKFLEESLANPAPLETIPQTLLDGLAGLDDVPLLSATEVAVPDAMPRVVRIMAHVESDIPRGQVEHVYLRGTESLRQDTAND